jgi:hypothetical protein
VISLLSAVTEQQPEVLQQIQGFLLGAATLIASVYGLWRFKPTRTIILRLVRTTTQSATDWFDLRIHRGVTIATNDIRQQVFPNREGSSVLDRTYRLEQAQEALISRVNDIREELDVIASKLEEWPK